MCFLKGLVLWWCITLCLFGKGRSGSEDQSKCAPFSNSSGLAQLCGYSATANFTHDLHYSMAARAAKSISTLIGNCSPYAKELVCSVYLPRCESHIAGPFLPCRRVCDEVFRKCKDPIRKNALEWIVGMCQLLPRKDNPTSDHYLERCYEPKGFKSPIKPESEPKTLQCYPLVVPICQRLGYTQTVLSETKQKAYSGYATRVLSKHENDSDSECLLMRKRFFCTENFPACIDKKVAFFCRDRCETFFKRNCTSVFFYDSTMCMEFPEGQSSIDICKQNHWPRAENWPFIKRGPPTPPVTGVTKASTNSASNQTGNPSMTAHPGPPGVYGKLHHHGSAQAGAIAGGVMAAVCVIILAAGVGWCVYKRKTRERFPYDKQILYADDSVDM